MGARIEIALQRVPKSHSHNRQTEREDGVFVLPLPVFGSPVRLAKARSVQTCTDPVLAILTIHFRRGELPFEAHESSSRRG
jgi:hypothetical protein